MGLPDHFYLGTSSWTAESWNGVFYPRGTPPADYLAHYGRRFRSVEVDATWYHVPSARTVDGWNERTPDGFVFSAKVPQVITHQKVLKECEVDLEAFVEVMRRLGPKLGVLLFQFPYFNKRIFPDLSAFLERLFPFLQNLPGDVRFALEVRNKGWLTDPLFEALRQHHVALAWIDHPWMPGPRQYARIPGAVTSDFLYVRWLGDRYKIEEVTQTWDRLVYDRREDAERWAEVLKELSPRVDRFYGYYNNHYAGCAFQSALQFEEAWG
jgi:uncharacterized protein YecE (DUF72 family)